MTIVNLNKIKKKLTLKTKKNRSKENLMKNNTSNKLIKFELKRQYDHLENHKIKT
jgi:hypothetical protein